MFGFQDSPYHRLDGSVVIGQQNGFVHGVPDHSTSRLGCSDLAVKRVRYSRQPVVVRFGQYFLDRPDQIRVFNRFPEQRVRAQRLGASSQIRLIGKDEHWQERMKTPKRVERFQAVDVGHIEVQEDGVKGFIQ